jgi:hypothetical protein
MSARDEYGRVNLAKRRSSASDRDYTGPLLKKSAVPPLSLVAAAPHAMTPDLEAFPQTPQLTGPQALQLLQRTLDDQEAGVGTEQSMWASLPAVILRIIAIKVGSDSFTVLAMHQTCRSWHLGLGPINKPKAWTSRSLVFGVRFRYVAWALESGWLDPAGALTLACRLTDSDHFVRQLKRFTSGAKFASQLRGLPLERMLMGLKDMGPVLTPLPAEVHRRHEATEADALKRCESDRQKRAEEEAQAQQNEAVRQQQQQQNEATPQPQQAQAAEARPAHAAAQTPQQRLLAEAADREAAQAAAQAGPSPAHSAASASAPAPAPAFASASASAQTTSDRPPERPIKSTRSSRRVGGVVRGVAARFMAAAPGRSLSAPQSAALYGGAVPPAGAAPAGPGEGTRAAARIRRAAAEAARRRVPASSSAQQDDRSAAQHEPHAASADQDPSAVDAARNDAASAEAGAPKRPLGSRPWMPLRGRLEEALHAAVDANNLSAVVFLHRELGLTPEQARSRNNFALRMASFHNRLPIVRYLMDQLKLRLVDLKSNQAYAIRMACDNGSLELVKMLMQAGLTAEDLCANENEALCAACVKGHTEVVRYIITHGQLTADDVRARRLYPFRSACWRGYVDIVKILVSTGLTMEDITKDGFALSMATRYNHIDLLVYLVGELRVPLTGLAGANARRQLEQHGHTNLVTVRSEVVSSPVFF